MKILYTNDMHNRLAALDWLESMSPELRQQYTLLDGGDAIAGSNTAFRLDERALRRMRALGYKAMAMGNREFHYFRWLLRWREQERGFPVLAANLVDLRQSQQDWLSYIVIDQVAFVGLTVVQFPVGHFWEKVTGFRFLPPEKALADLWPQLQGYRQVILMSHLGLAEDRRLASLFPQIPLILGSHTHEVLTSPVMVGNTAIVQGGSHSRYIAEIEIDCQEAFQLTYHLRALA